MAKEECLEWLRFAQDDLEAAEYLTGMHAKKLEIICYHCQQCAEKSLKSLYAFQDIEIPRSHDFQVLTSGLTPVYAFDRLDSEFATLQPFAVAVRYPFEIELVSGDDGRAIRSARLILDTCFALVEK